MMHDSRYATKQGLLVDLAGYKTIIVIVDQAKVGPAACDQRPASLRAQRLDGDPGADLRDAHADEADIDRWRAGF